MECDTEFELHARKRVHSAAEKGVRSEMAAETHSFLCKLASAWGLPQQSFRAFGYQVAAKQRHPNVNGGRSFTANQLVEQLAKCTPHKAALLKALTRKPKMLKAIFQIYGLTQKQRHRSRLLRDGVGCQCHTDI